MVVEESIQVIFYESNNSLQERESVDDDLGLETYMGRFQLKIEDNKKRMELILRKKDHHWHYHFLNKCKVNQTNTFLENGSLSSITYKIKSLVIHLVG